LRFVLSSEGQRDALRQGTLAEREEVIGLDPQHAEWERALALKPEIAEDGTATLGIKGIWAVVIRNGEPDFEYLTGDQEYNACFQLWHKPYAQLVETGELEPLDVFPDVDGLLAIEEENQRERDAALTAAEEQVAAELLPQWEEWILLNLVPMCTDKLESWRNDPALAYYIEQNTFMEEDGEEPPELTALASAMQSVDTDHAELDTLFCDAGRRMAELLKQYKEHAAKEKDMEEAATWIREHGTPRLRKALDLNLLSSSMAVYRDERLAEERPGWGWAGEMSQKGIINPPEWALDVLAEAREQFKWAGLAYEDSSAHRGAVVTSRFLGRPIVCRTPPPEPDYEFSEEPF
jgi:hypothetical protein